MAWIIRDSTVIPAGEVYNLQYSASEGGYGVSLTSSAFGSRPTLVNRGELRFASPTTASRPSLILATASGAWWEGVIENYGVMSASGGQASSGSGVRLLWADWTPRILNAGSMTVEGGDAVVILGDRVKDQTDALPGVENTGRISAVGSNSAAGVWFSYTTILSNSGSITASLIPAAKGTVTAISVGGESTIRNSGQIIADDGDTASARSTAIFFGAGGTVGQSALIVNTGLISGDVAIREGMGGGSFENLATSRIENYKDIVGKVWLGNNTDTVLNRGSIVGDIDLGWADDVYNGVGGHVSGVVSGGAGADTFLGGEGQERFDGGVGNDVLAPGSGTAIFDGGLGADRVDFSQSLAGAYSGRGRYAVNFSLHAEADGSITIRNRMSPIDVTTTRNVESAVFADKTVDISFDFPAETAIAFASILRVSSADVSQRPAAATVLNAIFEERPQAEINMRIVNAAGATTSVATLSYQFFTGKIPGEAGIDYLIAPTGPNANNLNSVYYQTFNLENRYINFAVNLGKLGEGETAFSGKYGGLSLVEATREAYKTIYGAAPTDAKIHAMIDSRIDYFAAYGGDGPNGVGTKAAMVGWLLAEAQKADLGVMVRSNDAWLADAADRSAPFAINILDPSRGYWKPEFIFGGQ